MENNKIYIESKYVWMMVEVRERMKLNHFMNNKK